jgi:hypothetical protein
MGAVTPFAQLLAGRVGSGDAAGNDLQRRQVGQVAFTIALLVDRQHALGQIAQHRRHGRIGGGGGQLQVELLRACVRRQQHQQHDPRKSDFMTLPFPAAVTLARAGAGADADAGAVRRRLDQVQRARKHRIARLAAADVNDRGV